MTYELYLREFAGRFALLGGVCLLHRAGLAEPKSIPGLVA